MAYIIGMSVLISFSHPFTSTSKLEPEPFSGSTSGIFPVFTSIRSVVVPCPLSVSVTSTWS